MRDWLSKRRTLPEILADIDVSTDETQVARIRAEMTDKAMGSRFIDMSSLAEQVRQSKEQRLMPEYIERFFIEAYRSFGGTITQDKARKGIWTISRVPPNLRKAPESIERRFGKVGQTYPSMTFDKANTGSYQEVEFVGPGHPLFEGVVERVLREYGPALLRGAVFYNADATAPEILWLLKTGIEDGQSRTIGQRLSGVHKQDGEFRKIQPYALLDLKSPDDPPAVDAEIQQAAHEEDEVIDWSLDEVVAPYFQEVSERRGHELAIKEKYIRKSLNYLIAESNRKIMGYDRKIGSFLDPNDRQALNIKGNRGKEVARRDELVHRRDVRLAELEHERQLSEQPPEVLGVAVILPMEPAPSAEPSGSTAMRRDPEVEAIAIEVTKKHEREQGRKPVSVEEENCGWDITSLTDGQVARYIEVKGRATDGVVALTPNEWIKAQRFGTDYWLYIVTHCKSEPQLHMINDPASKLTPSEEVSVVRYMVKPDDWKAATTTAKGRE